MIVIDTVLCNSEFKFHLSHLARTREWPNPNPKKHFRQLRKWTRPPTIGVTVKCGIAIDAKCVMAIELGSRIRVKVMARAWVMVMFRVVFCSSIAQFLRILCILHCADAEWVWQ